ncbi:hypothetical protein LshimejAT787_0503310 [Lyophyllum shimeji]|uniref:Uncharacterized protein n=1 Tax=Lyophyllum shimeji TaxID=47721 RepID=A0A9P3PMM9_LYOSH|nr:hypothetical protein LshimejAT787_0503310 [Lyophyllum shimeji]
MEAKSSPHPVGNPSGGASPPAFDSQAGRLKTMMVLCTSSVCIVEVLYRWPPVSEEGRVLANLSLPCASMGAICATLAFVGSSIMRSMGHPQGRLETIESRWQRWMRFPVPMLWGTSALVLLISAALSHFYGLSIPRVIPTHERAIATSMQVLGVVCVGSTLASFRRCCKPGCLLILNSLVVGNTSRAALYT